MTRVRDFFVQVLVDVPIGERFDSRVTPEQAVVLAPGGEIALEECLRGGEPARPPMGRAERGD